MVHESHLHGEHTLFERPMPATDGARKYKKLLGVLAVFSLIGIALAVRAIIGTAVDWRVGDISDPWRGWAENLLHIAMGIAIIWIAYRALRHDRAPTTLAIAIVVLLSTAATIVRSVMG